MLYFEFVGQNQKNIIFIASTMLQKIKSLKDGAYEYDQRNKLGEGSFAKVYKGIITKNKRVVAIRLLPLKLIDQYGDKIKEIITGEVCVLKELSLSDSVDAMFTTRIYDCFMTQNNVVMILEFCPEGNLEDVLKKGPLSESEALEILYQLARGLQFIAKEKVVHRDIKPDNIFIKKQGNYKIFKLGDFGFAVKKQLNSQIVGTPIFMSPELFKEQKYGSEVDVWAFGLMAHYVLFKQHYFLAANEDKIKKRVLNEKYELKNNQLNKISKQMVDFLTRCLKLNKNERLPATTISQHPVFNPVRQKIQTMMQNVLSIQNVYQSQLLKSSLKGKVTSQIVKYSFLIDLATSFARINPYNYASLYILKHALGELHILKNYLQNRYNFLGHPDWNTYCTSEDYEKNNKILRSLMQKCQHNFQNSFNVVIPAVRGRHGSQVSEGIQQNLGKGPYDQIKPEIISYELQKNWWPWLQQNKNPQTHLLGLQLILALHIYKNNGKQVNFDFTSFEMQKNEMNLAQRTQYLEKALKNLNG